jgi:hypothetical protein
MYQEAHMNNIDDIEYNAGAVSPTACLREGWEMIKDDYWFFVGITFVGVFLAQMAPMAILFGPMMCGIYICLLQQERGKKVKFEMLFQGFNFFGPSLIATLVELAPTLVLAIAWYILMFVGMFAMIAAAGPNQGGPPPDGLLIGFFGTYVGGIIMLIVVSLVMRGFLLFSYLLIVDKNVSGWDAVRLSFRAARANVGGILGVLLLSLGLSMVGFLFCGIGIYLEMPLSFAMYTIAYRQVFPHRDPFERFRDDHDEEQDDDERPARTTGEGEAETAVKVDPLSS